ncbi:MAG: phosphotransferase family protein [Pseudomonadota bacterium]
MELSELEVRLRAFVADCYVRDDLRIEEVVKMPGHAGFAYGYRVRGSGVEDDWFLRLPPPNVRWVGTADVLRQVCVLNALDDTDVPHCSVRWSGDDPQWFGSPYFVVPWLEGDVLRLQEGEWGASLDDAIKQQLGNEIMTALAKIHRVPVSRLGYLGEPVPFREDVERWDRFYEKAADPERLARVPEVRQLLLDTLPDDAPIGLFHGDFQTANLFCSLDGHLKAVIDFELCGIGATLNDVGWICTFSDAAAWPTTPGEGARPLFLDPETLSAQYAAAYGDPLPDLRWFRALAAYKFAIITGLNLSLHRRGKRVDPLWEETKFAMTTLTDRAASLLMDVKAAS